MNQASVDRHIRYSCDVLAEHLPGQLAAIFTPQHGLWCEQQANMIETPHGHYQPLNVPIYSLYSETRRPTEAMLDAIEVLVVDLQDVGTRVYTFAWTVVECMRACARRGIPMLILDRPNPLNGRTVEGPILHTDYRSFVGLAEIPVRHGLTIGELARFVNVQDAIGADIEVVEMTGWNRDQLFNETGLPWVPPSPNMPRLETALLYPGQVLLEGTNLSEGRGTTIPFEVFGAPYIEADELLKAIDGFELPGLSIRIVHFRPTFDKWINESCAGLASHILDPRQVRSFQLAVTILAAVNKLWPDQFAWRSPPYEYEHDLMPIDILYGNAHLRERVAHAYDDPDAIEDLCEIDVAAWNQLTRPYRLYA